MIKHTPSTILGKEYLEMTPVSNVNMLEVDSIEPLISDLEILCIEPHENELKIDKLVETFQKLSVQKVHAKSNADYMTKIHDQQLGTRSIEDLLIKLTLNENVQPDSIMRIRTIIMNDKIEHTKNKVNETTKRVKTAEKEIEQTIDNGMGGNKRTKDRKKKKIRKKVAKTCTEKWEETKTIKKEKSYKT